MLILYWRVKRMTKEGAKIIRGALEAISEQCKATRSCANCPLYYYCQEEVGLFEVSPNCWCFGRRLR